MKKPRPFTESDVDRAAGLTAMLNVLAHAARFAEEVGESELGRLVSNLGQTLELASVIAGELTVHIEEHETRPDGGYASENRRSIG